MQNRKIPLRRSSRAHCLASIAFLACSVLLQAQQSAAGAGKSSAEDEAIELSPFIILSEKETGWSANDTLSATRTKQALKDVPVNIDAITADFIEDLGMFTADEVALYVANVWAAPTMENDSQGGNFSFRGLSGGNGVSRNYFRWYIPADTYNVERIDFGKGSNSLIFGDNEPGGMGSVFTKRALMRDATSVFGFQNSDGAYRYQIDINRRIKSNWAMRFNAVHRQEKTFQDASAYKFKGATVTTSWQPTKTTMVRFEMEQGEFENVRGFAGVAIREISARSRAFTSSGFYYTSDGVWVNRATLPSADRSNGPTGGSPSLVEGSFFDVTMRNASGAIVGTKRFEGYPKHYNIRGAFDQQGRPFDTYTLAVEQRFGPVGCEFSFNHQNTHATRTDNYFSNTISVDVNGRPYIDTTLDKKHFGNEIDQFRAMAVYRWAPLRWMEQLIVGSYDYREDAVDNYRWQYFNVKRVENGTAPTVDLTNDRGRLRLYLDDPQFYSRAVFDKMKPDALPITDTVHMVPLGLFADGGGATSGTEWRKSYAFSLSASGRWFKGRIQTLLGLRRDFHRTYEYIGTRTYGTYNEAVFVPKRQEVPEEYQENMNLHLANTTKTGGLTLKLTEDINFYGVYSESFRFQDVRTFDRERFGPITGVTKEVGLKGNFWGDRGSFTLGVFDIDRQNVAITWNNVFSFTREEIEDMMNPNDILPGDPRYIYAEEGTASASRYYKSTENSRGADLTLMLRPVKGLQMRFTVARTRVLGQPDLNKFRKYYEAAVARGNENQAILNEAKNLLDSLDIDTKPTGARAVPWSASWIVDYAFPREAWTPLKGLRIGANGSWRDDYLFGISNSQELIGGSTHLVNAYAMRDQKIWGQNVRIRLGVKNITDLENGKLRKTGFTTLNSGENLYRYSYVMPMVWDLSVTVRF